MGDGLKYPVLMVHGMGFRDRKVFGYWGRIPKMLEREGCRVFFGGQDSNGDIPSNAEVVARRIDEIIAETGAEKVNVIAHSKGGLDTRYAISVLERGDKVASLTTISTPHHGSRTVDLLLKFPRPIVRLGCIFVDAWFGLLGDEKPRTYSAIVSFTTKAAEEFNAQVPDREDIYYQSYAFVMKRPTSDMMMWFTNAFVYMIEGKNDGLLAPRAVKWGDFKGVYSGVGNRGISHCDEVDMRRCRLSRKRGEGVADITDVYKEIYATLRSRGL